MLAGIPSVASCAYQPHSLFSSQRGGKKRQRVGRKYELRSGVGQMRGAASAVSLKTREALGNERHQNFVISLKLGG